MDKPKHIILLIADSLRYDTVWQTGRSRLPFLESQSTVFHQAYSAGCWTLPSTASIFTGLYPHQHGSTTRTRGLDTGIPTLAEALKEQGYLTVQLTANTVTTHIFGLNRGFDRTEKIWQIVNPTKSPLGNFIVLFGKRRVRKKFLQGDLLTGKMTEDIQASQGWIRSLGIDQLNRSFKIIEEAEQNNQKLFLFLNLMETHFPYHIDNKFRLRSHHMTDKYNEIKSLFHLVNQSWLSSGKQYFQEKFLRILRNRQRVAWRRLSRFLDHFAESLHKRYPDTLFIFTSDHGDNFGDEGWNYHFSNVTEAGNRVPLFISGPGIQAEKQDYSPVSISRLYHFIRWAAEQGIDLNRLSDPEKATILESYWYDKSGNTLDRYRNDQFAFVDEQKRYVMDGENWKALNIATRDSAQVQVDLLDGNPIEELAMPGQRKKDLQEKYTKFQKFSQSI